MHFSFLKKCCFIFFLIVFNLLIFGESTIEFDAEELPKPVEYTIRGLGIASLYYISDQPKILGLTQLVSLFLGGYDDINEALFLITPPIAYNFLIAEKDVGNEGRFEVFAINAGLMVAGHYTYKWFFKKDEDSEEKKTSSVSPVISSQYQGLVYTKYF